MKQVKVLTLFAACAFFLAFFVACATGPALITNAQGLPANGTATGSAQGFGGVVSVTLTLENGEITNVAVVAAHESAMFAAPVISRVNADMIRLNTASIDIVSGATVTSVAVNQAAADALNQIISQ